jgi:hypothetical protein
MGGVMDKYPAANIPARMMKNKERLIGISKPPRNVIGIVGIVGVHAFPCNDTGEDRSDEYAARY